MTESTLNLIAALKLFCIVGFAWLYSSGGISGKWKRRFVAPLLLTLCIIGFSLWTSTFNLWYLLFFPLMVGALSLGYGGTSTGQKILKRSLFGLAIATAALPIVIVNSLWPVWGLHILLCLAVNVTLGVLNPFSARAEETLIGFTAGFLPIFMIGG